MSECPPFEDLSALTDGDLSSEQESEVRQHLDGCASCRRELDGLIALKGAVGRAYDSELPSPTLRRAVAASFPKRRRRRIS